MMMLGRPYIKFISITFICLVVFSSWQILTTLIQQLIIEEKLNYTHVPKSREGTAVLYSQETLPKWDFIRLINFEGFTFLTTNAVCKEDKIEVLVVVHSAPENLERRNAIRDTWGQSRQNLRTVFMLAMVNNQEMQDKLDAEDNTYHDLVQGNFMEHYKNLTYKQVMSFKYTIYYCPQTKFVLKTDDDIFVNINYVFDFIHKNVPPDGAKDYILCNIMDGSPALREQNKWFVPFNEFPHRYYPVYCSGFAIIYSYDVVFRLYREAQRGEYFWVDDAHISGTLAKRINVKHKSLPSNALQERDTMNNFIASEGKNVSADFFYGAINIQPDIVRKLWVLVNNTTKLNNSTRGNS